MVKARPPNPLLKNVVGAGKRAVGGALLDKCKTITVDCGEVNSMDGADATRAAGSPEVTGRGALSSSSKSASLGGAVGGAFNGLKFGGGCNSPQVRVPASASGQGTVAVGSPNPRAIGGHMNSLRCTHSEVRQHTNSAGGKK